jgi:hypothetical protein
MSLYAEIGTVVRALPTDDGLEIKLQKRDGSTMLLVPADRPELVAEARAARMSGEEVSLRRTDRGLVVALNYSAIRRAA